MKKFVCLIIMTLMLQTSFAAVTDSNNAFEIELREAPPGGGDSHHGGLSDGAVTAITLGSVFGGLGLLGGAGYYFFKNSGLACGFACGEKSPYMAVELKNPEIITKSCNTYLIKAYEQTKKENARRFLLIPDSTIKPNTYNTVFFEIPDEFINAKFEIVQASSDLNVSKNIPELDTDIFLKSSAKIPTSSSKIDSENKIMIKQGKISNNKNNILEVRTSCKTKNKSAKPIIYAVVVCLYE